MPRDVVFTLVISWSFLISWSFPTDATIISLCATRLGDVPLPNKKLKANTLHEVDGGNMGLGLQLGRAVAMW